jgi:sec-independent protein translocase protein TatB
MDFLGIGPLEIALIALVAFIVLGPDRIPGVMRQLGKWTRQLRETANNITRDYNTDIREITGEITALQDEIRSIQRDLGSIATGIMTPPAGAPPARSNTAAPGESNEPEPAATSSAIIQSMTDDIKRASASMPPASIPPASVPSESAETNTGDTYEI